MKYDATIIETFAERLYKKANSIIFTYTLAGIGLGALGGLIGHTPGALFGALILGFIGYSIGTDKAFQYKLQAQTALCQVQIERNTRGSKMATHA